MNMRKNYAVLLLVCCASVAYATDYNPLTDWVKAPGEPVAWQFGGRIETDYGTGVFGDFIPGVHDPAIAGYIDGYIVPNSASTCMIIQTDPWRGNPGPVLNAWVNYQATARVTPKSGIYDVEVSFIGTGYAASGTQSTNVYVVKNGTDILWQGLIEGPTDYTVPVGTTLTNLAFMAGDYLDFISANNGPGESRSSLTADLIAQEVLLAWGPSPEDGAVDVDMNTSLCWNGPANDPNYPDPNGYFFSYNVYYGPADDLNNLASPFLVSGGEPHCYTPAAALDPETEYAWRVDVLIPNGPIRTGNVWTFTTGPSYDPAELVSPAPSGVTGVAYDAILDWNNTLDVEWANVYFSTNETLVTSRDPSVQVLSQTTETSHDPFGIGLMAAETTYYWVVDEGVGTEVVAPGTVWSFTTKLLECLAPVSNWDGNGDCVIDLVDFAQFASLWLQCGYDNPDACPGF